MDVIILDVVLAFVGGGDVGFGIFDKIAPADTADVGVLASPDGGANITNALVIRFAIEHIIPHNGEDHMVMMDCAALGAAGASLQIIVVRAICVRKNDG